MQWIQKDIVIDFTLPNVIWGIFSELEELERKQDSVGYMLLADELDIMCKNGDAEGAITKEQ